MENLPVTYDCCKMLLKAFEVAEANGYPSDKDELFRAKMIQQEIKKRMEILEKERWQGFRK